MWRTIVYLDFRKGKILGKRAMRTYLWVQQWTEGKSVGVQVMSREIGYIFFRNHSNK